MVKPSSSPFPAFVCRRGWLVVVGLAFLALAYWLLQPGSGRRSGERQPGRWNVVLVTIDTLRADHVGVYGAGRALTPAIDALAGSGVRFEHCIAQAPLTLPSHASLLSATQPLFHRVRDNGTFRVPGELELLSEVLHERGFSTAAFIGGYVLHGKWGLNQGFDLYSDRFDPGTDGNLLLQAKKPAATVLGDARRWLDENGEKRFFTWIHLYDPHFPYTPPPPFDQRCGGDPYRGEVEYADHELGRFFEYLRQKGWYDRTLIVVTSDHGEGLNDHGEQKHGYFLYETTIHVPLVLRAPVPFAVSSVSRSVQLVDVAPTILDLLGIALPPQWQGKTMLSLLDGKPDERFGVAYSETWYPRLHFGWSHLRTFISDQTKYIYAPRDELYDLRRDPGEERNLAAEDPRRRNDLRGRGLLFMQKSGRRALTPGNIPVMDAADRRRLAALGYLAGSLPTVEDAGSLPDPKDKLADYVAFGKAVALLGEGHWQEALAAARGIVERNPEFADAVNLEGNALFAAGRHSEALEVFQQALLLKPEDPNYRLDLLKTLMEMGNHDAAAAEAQRFLRDAPADAALLAALGRIRLAQKEDREGLRLLRQALAADPGIYPQLNQAAETLIARQAFSGA
ncbi:MAG: sulfatase-like hydrolase/transferase, partial [Calditerricola sp.]|nr:sulfatase-like hydrolase/transferase [Calditerricola sp.]